MPVTGYTVSELMEKSGRSRASVVTLLSRHDIKPLSYEAIYPPDALDVILAAKRGRPRNPVIERAEAARNAFREAVNSGDPKEIIKKSEDDMDASIELLKVISSAPHESLDELMEEVERAGLNRPVKPKNPKKPKT